jgi:hypothetical protein
MYALRNLLRDFAVFYGGVNDLWIIILYAAKIEGWVVGLYGLVVIIPACKPQVPEFESTRRFSPYTDLGVGVKHHKYNIPPSMSQYPSSIVYLY